MGDGKIKDGRTDPKTAKAIARRRELREINASEVEQVAAQLIAGLGRAPIGGEVVAAETIAATLVAGRRLRERGHSDAVERQLLRRLLAFTPFGVTPPTPPRIDPAAPGTYFVATKGKGGDAAQVAEPSPAEIQHGSEVARAYEAHDAARARAASREPWEPATDEETATDEVSNNAD
jgi:hypothetical protein